MPRRVLPLLIFSLILGFSTFTSSMADESDDTIITAQDLEALGEQAHERKLPILIMFTQTECSYCTIMEEDYLRPMLLSGEYTDKVIIRKIKIDEYDTLTNFDGSRIEADKLPGHYRAWVTPTLVFLNGDGKEIAPKLVGIGTEGFFAKDIDNAIDAALMHLNSMASN